MPKSGAIVIVEDDVDDKDVLKMTLLDLGFSNPLRWFKYTSEAWDYLKSDSEAIFLIFCDVNLPIQSGLEFKQQIDADPELRKKSIPFVFMTTSGNQNDINKAYTQMTVQGYFQKSNSYEDLKDMIQLILKYWTVCKHPNTQ